MIETLMKYQRHYNYKRYIKWFIGIAFNLLFLFEYAYDAFVLHLDSLDAFVVTFLILLFVLYKFFRMYFKTRQDIGTIIQAYCQTTDDPEATYHAIEQTFYSGLIIEKTHYDQNFIISVTKQGFLLIPVKSIVWMYDQTQSKLFKSYDLLSLALYNGQRKHIKLKQSPKTNLNEVIWFYEQQVPSIILGYSKENAQYYFSRAYMSTNTTRPTHEHTNASIQVNKKAQINSHSKHLSGLLLLYVIWIFFFLLIMPVGLVVEFNTINLYISEYGFILSLFVLVESLIVALFLIVQLFLIFKRKSIETLKKCVIVTHLYLFASSLLRYFMFPILSNDIVKANDVFFILRVLYITAQLFVMYHYLDSSIQAQDYFEQSS